MDTQSQSRKNDDIADQYISIGKVRSPTYIAIQYSSLDNDNSSTHVSDPVPRKNVSRK